MPAYHNLTPKNKSYEGISQLNGKEMQEMSWYLFGVVTQTLWGGSPIQRPIFNHAVECTGVVLATAPGYPARVQLGTGILALVQFWNRHGTSPHLQPQFFGRVLPTAERHLRQLRTFAPIKYWSSDRITLWYICKRCSFECTFTPFSPICDPIKIHPVTVKESQKLGIFHSDSMNIHRIANWRNGGETACTTASFMYISYCDTIRSQILHWSQSSKLAKLWNQLKNHGFGAVRFLEGVQPVATVPVQIQPGPWTEPRIWNHC